MSDEQQEAIGRLERRVALLEEAVRRLIAARAVPDPARAARSTELTPPPLATSHPKPSVPDRSAATRSAADLEQWFGQRGLLFVGVLALLAAAAFLLKYAFDRGWIPPLIRASLAVAAGCGVGVWGEDRIRRGMRRYGAAMIGAGGGLAYLGLWAAAGPYALIERRLGVLLLAAATIAVTVLARRHKVEGLAVWALVGAYLGPILLAPPVPNPDAFLGYLEVIGLGTAILAHVMGWRGTFDLALFGNLLLAAAGAASALRSPLGSWLIATAALLTLQVTRERTWPEARLGVVLVAWAILSGSLRDVRGAEPRIWLALGAAAAVWGLLWSQQSQHDPFANARPRGTGGVERVLFLANPFALLLLARAAGPRLLENAPGALPTVLAAIYLTAGWRRRSASLLVMGFALAALAMALEWSATNVVLGWTGLALAAVAADRRAGRPGGHLAAVALAAGAVLCLFTVALESREPGAPVFGDAWAFALYAYVAGAAVCARAWGPGSNSAGAATTLRQLRGAEVFWLLGGAAVFAGGSIQFGRYFGRITPVASDLALSLWWLAYAGALVWLGFRLNRRAIRSAGLAVAGGAGLKIVLYDLAALEALYRVASFFGLALIALAVAYAYNRKARASAA